MKSQALTYTEAVNHFFGGIQHLAKLPLPFKCSACGKNYYTENYKDDEGVKQSIQLPMMGVNDLYKHVRRDHGEKIKRLGLKGVNV